MKTISTSITSRQRARYEAPIISVIDEKYSHVECFNSQIQMINRFIQISSQKGPEKAYSPEIGFSSTLNLLDVQIQKEILKYGKLFRFGPEFFEKIRNKDLQIAYLKSKEFQHAFK
jgi:peptide subunit release factor RF-3